MQLIKTSTGTEIPSTNSAKPKCSFPEENTYSLPKTLYLDVFMRQTDSPKPIQNQTKNRGSEEADEIVRVKEQIKCV